MSTSQEFSEHHKLGHYETKAECSRAFPRAPEDLYSVENTKKMDQEVSEASILDFSKKLS